ncbi:hypothetical protein HDU76_009068 [Blyttiomyces sp. JEL0837]|nr:hypothetical protein HDU76_009068 [Blyttiomyces sp. JEL0837]
MDLTAVVEEDDGMFGGGGHSGPSHLNMPGIRVLNSSGSTASELSGTSALGLRKVMGSSLHGLASSSVFEESVVEEDMGFV